MGYKLNIRNAGNDAWINLLQAEYLSVKDTNGYFSATDIEGTLDEIFETKVDRVESASAPTATDDSYQIGGIWVNTTSDTVYVMVDNTPGSAIWMDVSSLEVEDIQDIVGDMVDGGTEGNIAVTYDDTAGKLNFTVETATDSTLGAASFDSAFFDVTTGHVELKAGGVTVTELANNIDATGIG